MKWRFLRKTDNNFNNTHLVQPKAQMFLCVSVVRTGNDVQPAVEEKIMSIFEENKDFLYRVRTDRCLNIVSVSEWVNKLSDDVCNYDTPFPPSQPHPAVNRAFNTLGRRQKKPSSTICTKRALTLKANRNAH